MKSPKAQCTLCRIKYGRAVFTDQLKLRTIDGRDYFVCEKDDKDFYGAKEKRMLNGTSAN